jgi:hypothetical protein
MVVEISKSPVAVDKHVIYTWIPSHICIHGSIVVDQESIASLINIISNSSIPYTMYEMWKVKIHFLTFETDQFLFLAMWDFLVLH